MPGNVTGECVGHIASPERGIVSICKRQQVCWVMQRQDLPLHDGDQKHVLPEGRAMPWRLIRPLMVYISRGISVGDTMITCRGVHLPCGQLHHIRKERVDLQARGSLSWYRCPAISARSFSLAEHMRFASVHLLSMLVSMNGVLLPPASILRLYAWTTR
jgi:hypothetical protein